MARRIVLILLYLAALAGLSSAIILDLTSGTVKAPAPPPQVVHAPKAVPSPTSPKRPSPSSSGSSGTVPNRQTTPAAPPTNQPTTPSAPPLTNTGPGDVLLLFAAGVITGTAGYTYHQRRKLAAS